MLAWRVTKSCRPLLLVSTLHIVTHVCSGGGKFLDTSRMCDVLYCAKISVSSAVADTYPQVVCAPMANIWFSILQNVTPLWKHEPQTQTLNVISAIFFLSKFCCSISFRFRASCSIFAFAFIAMCVCVFPQQWNMNRFKGGHSLTGLMLSSPRYVGLSF